VDTLAVFAIGTGIGGGLVVNRQLHLGIGETGGELGHTVIDFNGPRCGCGNYGCLEAYASGPAIAAMGMKAVAQGLTTRLSEMCKYDLNRITPKLIAQAAQEGDEIAKDIFEKAGFLSWCCCSQYLLCYWTAPNHHYWGSVAGRRTITCAYAPHPARTCHGYADRSSGNRWVTTKEQCRRYRGSLLGRG